MLAATGDLGYIHEPLNPGSARALLSLDAGTPYRLICAENEASYLEPLQRLARFEYPLLRELAAVRSSKDVVRVAQRAARFTRAAAFRQRPLFKDPFAVFSVEWFEARLGCRTIVSVRHPAAVVSSVKRLGWAFDSEYLLGQPYLVDRWLTRFPGEHRALRRRPATILEQISILWATIYAVVLACAEANPRLILVRHEDICQDPLGVFRRLYAAVGVPWGPRAEQAIRSSSSETNPPELGRGEAHSVYLDSRAAMDSWRRRLTADEVSRIRGLTEHVAAHFYPEPAWWEEPRADRGGHGAVKSRSSSP
jgi:hypothetical protein